MSYDNRSVLQELHLTIRALEAGAETEPLPSHSLSLSVDATLEAYTDSLRSVAVYNVLPCRLLITVSATGELSMKELSTSAKVPGDSSPQSPYHADSPLSPYEVSQSPVEEPLSKTLDSPTRQWKHPFEGMLDENCVHCNMPYNASQHGRMLIHAGFSFGAYGPAGIVVVDPLIASTE